YVVRFGFFFQAEDGIRDFHVTGVQTCALPIFFDMDGTMFDTERLRFQTLQQASRELIGVEFSESYLMQCLGLSARSAEQLAKERYGQDVPYEIGRASCRGRGERRAEDVGLMGTQWV